VAAAPSFNGDLKWNEKSGANSKVTARSTTWGKFILCFLISGLPHGYPSSADEEMKGHTSSASND
jgi:hypothetical protein